MPELVYSGFYGSWGYYSGSTFVKTTSSGVPLSTGTSSVSQTTSDPWGEQIKSLPTSQTGGTTSSGSTSGTSYTVYTPPSNPWTSTGYSPQVTVSNGQISPGIIDPTGQAYSAEIGQVSEKTGQPKEKVEQFVKQVEMVEGIKEVGRNVTVTAGGREVPRDSVADAYGGRAAGFYEPSFGGEGGVTKQEAIDRGFVEEGKLTRQEQLAKRDLSFSGVVASYGIDDYGMEYYNRNPFVLGAAGFVSGVEEQFQFYRDMTIGIRDLQSNVLRYDVSPTQKLMALDKKNVFGYNFNPSAGFRKEPAYAIGYISEWAWELGGGYAYGKLAAKAAKKPQKVASLGWDMTYELGENQATVRNLAVSELRTPQVIGSKKEKFLTGTIADIRKSSLYKTSPGVLMDTPVYEIRLSQIGANARGATATAELTGRTVDGTMIRLDGEVSRLMEDSALLGARNYKSIDRNLAGQVLENMPVSVRAETISYAMDDRKIGQTLGSIKTMGNEVKLGGKSMSRPSEEFLDRFRLQGFRDKVKIKDPAAAEWLKQLDSRIGTENLKEDIRRLDRLSSTLTEQDRRVIENVGEISKSAVTGQRAAYIPKATVRLPKGMSLTSSGGSNAIVDRTAIREMNSMATGMGSKARQGTTSSMKSAGGKGGFVMQMDMMSAMRQDNRMNVDVIPIISQSEKTGQGMGMKYKSIVDSPSLSESKSKMRQDTVKAPVSPIPINIPISTLPSFRFPMQMKARGGGKYRSPFGRPKRKLKYTPSLAAWAGNIQRKLSRAERKAMFTGYELRPIPLDYAPRKRKRRKGR